MIPRSHKGAGTEIQLAGRGRAISGRQSSSKAPFRRWSVKSRAARRQPLPNPCQVLAPFCGGHTNYGLSVYGSYPCPNARPGRGSRLLPHPPQAMPARSPANLVPADFRNRPTWMTAVWLPSSTVSHPWSNICFLESKVWTIARNGSGPHNTNRCGPNQTRPKSSSCKSRRAMNLP